MDILIISILQLFQMCGRKRQIIINWCNRRVAFIAGIHAITCILWHDYGFVSQIIHTLLPTHESYDISSMQIISSI